LNEDWAKEVDQLLRNLPQFARGLFTCFLVYTLETGKIYHAR